MALSVGVEGNGIYLYKDKELLVAMKVETAQGVVALLQTAVELVQDKEREDKFFPPSAAWARPA